MMERAHNDAGDYIGWWRVTKSVKIEKNKLNKPNKGWKRSLAFSELLFGGSGGLDPTEIATELRAVAGVGKRDSLCDFLHCSQLRVSFWQLFCLMGSCLGERSTP